MTFYDFPNLQSLNNRAKAKDALRSIEWYVFRRWNLRGAGDTIKDYHTALKTLCDYNGACAEIVTAIALARMVENCNDLNAAETIRKANIKIYSLNAGLEDRAKLRYD